MDDDGQAERFREIALPHMNAAYRLARWLTRNHEDAQEVVQEAYLSAFSAFAGYRGGDGKHWILAIVRNASYACLRHKQREALHEVFDEDCYGGDVAAPGSPSRPDDNPEALLLLRDDTQRVRRELDRLPAPYREVLVLRELEGLSYREIAEVAGIPAGTVMSRLARARHLLLTRLTEGAG